MEKVSNAISLLINLTEDSALLWTAEVWEFDTIKKRVVRKADKQTAAIVSGMEGLDIESLLTLAQTTQKDTLFQKHKTKKLNSWEACLADETLLKKIKKIHQHALATLLNQAMAKNIPICLNMPRADIYEHYEVKQGAREPLQPYFQFEKTEDGMLYSMSLELDGKPFSLFGQKIRIICVEPALILINNKIYALEKIKAGFLKQFTEHMQVFIKKDFERTFFEKIILPISDKAEVSLIGYEQSFFNQPDRVLVKIFYHIFHKRYAIVFLFQYGPFTFSSQELKIRKSSLHFKEEAVPSAKIAQRDQVKERSILSEFASVFTNFQEQEGCFINTTLDQSFDELSDSLRNGLKLWQEKVDMPVDIQCKDESDNKLLLTASSIISTNQERPDWFDLHIVIKLDDKEIPFQKIIPYLKSNNPYYPLGEDIFFKIPDTWFEKFAGFIRLGIAQGERMLLPAKFQAAIPAELGEIVQPELSEPLHYEEEKLAPISLRTYQKEGVQWLIYHFNRSDGALLADDMGLGKTIQSISLLKLLQARAGYKNEGKITAPVQLSLFDPSPALPVKSLRVLILAPASVAYNWWEELKKFAPEIPVYLHSGSERTKTGKEWESASVVISNYSLLVRDVALFQTLQWDMLIADEAQYAKNPESSTHKAIIGLNYGFVIALSGTPIENSAMDLWSIFQICEPGLLPDATLFMSSVKETNGIPEIYKTILKPFILRRVKSDILKELPDLEIIERKIQMGGEQSELYERTLSAVRNELLEINEDDSQLNRFEILAQLMKLRQIANHPQLIGDDSPSAKEDVVWEDMLNLFEKNEKCIVFSSFEKHLQLYENKLQAEQIPYLKITGSVSSSKRSAILQEFEKSDVPFLLMTLKAGGTGLNIIAASYIMILDPWWNPATESQAIGRAHRIGQTKQVTVFKYISRNTIEEKILKLQMHKSALAADLLEAEGLGKVSSEQLLELLH